MSPSMRAVRYHEYGSPAVLEVETVPRPVPAAGEVLVEVHAAGVNPADAKVRDGVYQRTRGDDPVGLPRTPGSDVAGEVVAVGDGDGGFAAGDRVFGTCLHKDRQFGSHAEYVAVPVDRLAAIPDDVPTETAGAVALVGLTAWRALVDLARLGPGEVCLVHGGSGGVGHVAVQLAATAGATVVATVGSDPAASRVRDLGADHVLRYDRADLGDAIRDASGGVDVVLDHRVDEYLPLDVDVSNPGARVVVIGGQEACVDARAAKRAELTVHYLGISNLLTMTQLPRVGRSLSRLAVLLERGDLEVVIADTYSLDGIEAAHRRVVADSFVGKLVVVP